LPLDGFPGTVLALLGLAWDSWAGEVFFWNCQSDFTNEMAQCYGADRVGKKGPPCPFFLKLPSMAISPYNSTIS